MNPRTWLLLVLLLVIGTAGSRPLTLALMPGGTAYARDGAPVYGIALADDGNVTQLPFGGVLISPVPIGTVARVDVARKLNLGGIKYVPLEGSRLNYIRADDVLYKP